MDSSSIATTTVPSAAAGVQAEPTTCFHDADGLLPLLTKAIPTVTSFEHLDAVVQANAEGRKILARHSSSVLSTSSDAGTGADADAADDDDEEGKHKWENEHLERSSDVGVGGREEQEREEVTTELFVKRIKAASYRHKPWPDLRRTLMYARTEVRFYTEILPALRERGLPSDLTPTCLHAECDLSGIVGDDEGATEVRNAAIASSSDSGDELPLDGRGGFIVLESLGDAYLQDSPLTTEQAMQCLRALARLHAASWGDADLLARAAKRLSDRGGSYHLRIRNPNELERMEESWEWFMSNFEGVVPDLFEKERVRQLGRRIKDMAEYVSDGLSPSPSEPHATIVHGDFKAMNVFLPTGGCDGSDDGRTARLIDFASAGVGLGMSDVAMHVVHAVKPEDLRDGGDEVLVEAYLDALDAARKEVARTRGRGTDDVREYTRDEALRHYRLASVDYCRFILGRFWRSATTESFEKKRGSKNTTLINRSSEAAMAFIERVDRYLEDFEEERRRLRETPSTIA